MTNKYRSNFERSVAAYLKKKKIKYGYETTKFPFVQPAKKRVYIPDFELNGCFIECKGKLTKEDRDKLLWAREQNPDMRLFLVFMRGRNPIRKGSSTTYMMWAAENNIPAFDWDQQQDLNKWIKMALKEEQT